MSRKLSFAIAVNLLTENLKKGANTFKNSIRSMQMQVITFAAALGFGGLGLSGLLSRFRDVARETSRVITALKNVSTGTKGFADNLHFINDLANKYGLEINALTGNFAKFTASATQANMPMEQQKKVFESLSRASTAFGLSADDTNGVFLALSQMMGKGKISSEELRKQMGERIPIAMQAMAKAAGVSQAGLESLLKQGKLMSADIIPKFADALNEMIPNVDTDNLEASLNKLSNAFGAIINSSGFQSKYKALIDWLTELIKSAVENIKNIVIGIVAAIAFVITNGLTKVYRSYAATGQQIIANATITHNKLRVAIAARVEAEKRLEELKLQHQQAAGAKQVALVNQIEKAKQTLSATTAQVNTTHENAKLAAAKAAAAKTYGVWGIAASKIGTALKSMASSLGFMAIFAGITLVVQGIYKAITATDAFDEASKRLNTAHKQVNTSLSSEIRKLNSLNKKLSETKQGTEEYKKIKNDIVEQYGKYFNNLDKEIDKVGNLSTAYKTLVQNIKLSLGARQFQSFYTTEQEHVDKKTADALDKAYKTLIDKFGDSKGSSLYSKFFDSVMHGTALDMETLKIFEDTTFWDVSWGKNAVDGAVDFKRSIDQLRSDVRKETQAFNKNIKDYAEKYQISEEDFYKILSGEELGNKTVSNQPNDTIYKQDYEAARKEWETAKKELDKIEKEKSNYTTEQYTKAKQKEKTTKESFEALGGKTKESADDKALRAAEKRLEALRKLDEDDRKRQIEKQKFDLEMQQKAIDLMDDSFAKRTKQTLLNLKKEQLDIEEYQAELLKKQAEHAKNKFVSVHGTDKGFESYFADLKKNNFKDKDGKDIFPEGLRPKDIEKQVTEMLDAARAAQRKGLANINKDASEMLAEQRLLFASDLDRKLADINKYYDDEVQKAKGSAAVIAQLEQNRTHEKQAATTDDKIKQLDFSENLELERLAGMESIGMTELIEQKKLELTKQYIQLRIDALKALADAGDEDAKRQTQLYEAQLKKLNIQAPAKSLKALADKKIFDSIKNGFIKAGDSAEKAEEKTTSLLGAIAQKAGTVANITSELQAMFGGLDESLDMAMQTVGNIAQGFAQGGIVGGAMAVIGQGMQLFSIASAAAARHQQALKEIADARLASQRAYNLLLLEQNLLLKEAVTIFGEQQIKRAANAIANYKESLNNLRDEMQGGFTPNAALEKALKKQVASGGVAGMVAKLQLNEYQRKLNNYNKGIAALGNQQIVTGHKKTGLFGWGKGKDTYSSILDVYPDVIDAEGKLNKERLQTIIDTQKMSDETKNYLKNLIDLQEHAQKAQEELRSYLQSTFGVLGDDIMTSLENAIRDKGIDAWEAFGEAGAKVIEQLGKQIAYELFFAEKFKGLQKQLETVYGSGKDEKDIAHEAMNLVGKFYQGIGKDMELAQGFMENWQREAEKYGLELWKQENDTSQSASKGYSVSMDQDTGDKLLGRITAMQMSGLKIESMLSAISLDSKNIFNINNELFKQTNILNNIYQVNRNSFFEIEGTSKYLKGMNDKLSNIETYTKALE